MKPTRRHELTDDEWKRLQFFLLEQKPNTRRPAKNHRPFINNRILWILRTGAPWRDVPDRYETWQEVYLRFRR